MEPIGTLLRILLPLGMILGILIAGLYLLRKSPLLGLFPQNPIQILARCPLSHRESLLLVRVGKEVLLLGLSGSQITLLLRVEGESGLDCKEIPFQGRGRRDWKFETVPPALSSDGKEEG